MPENKVSNKNPDTTSNTGVSTGSAPHISFLIRHFFSASRGHTRTRTRALTGCETKVSNKPVDTFDGKTRREYRHLNNSDTDQSFEA